jgi:hypothetical protein
MAVTTGLHTLVQGWFTPGKTDNWHWNNAKLSCTYAFNVQPHAAEVGPVMEAEVTRVWRKHIQHPTNAEAEVHVWVKNVGNSSGWYTVLMSSICG